MVIGAKKRFNVKLKNPLCPETVRTDRSSARISKYFGVDPLRLTKKDTRTKASVGVITSKPPMGVSRKELLNMSPEARAKLHAQEKERIANRRKNETIPSGKKQKTWAALAT